MKYLTHNAHVGDLFIGNVLQNIEENFTWDSLQVFLSMTHVIRASK
jgi:hypothetical protein